ncbi:protein NPGR2-like isoform X2 [Amaranthus tricolor]|nr:protein NPGR2-like isoform X2 [Amaranthus tricolor]XP_057531474.1 protein NPGR2-like isoform X2 [Amaranthus tricolor]
MKAENWRRSCGFGGEVKLKKIMKCIFFGKQVRADEVAESLESSLATRDYSASGHSAQAGEAVVKNSTNPSTIEEAESSLRASGYLNYEEARALLGRLEFQKGNIEAAFSVFNGIDIDAIIPNIKITLARIYELPRRSSNNDAVLPMSMHAVNILFEAIFLKSKSLMIMGKFEEAAQSCQVIVDTVESAIPQGLDERFATNLKMQETLNKVVELLPELWKLAGEQQKVISSYRSALLYGWNLELVTQAKMEKEFAIFLLYSGVDGCPPTLRFQVDGVYIPCNNIEEAILLLLLVLRKFLRSSLDWDPSIVDHLSFALSVSGDLETLARQLEELSEGTVDRKEKYRTLALCYHGQGEDKISLNLLRNLLRDRENQNCTRELLLASKICAGDRNCSEEGITYSDKANKKLEGDCALLAGKASCFLGTLSLALSRLMSSDSKRASLQAQALNLLGTAEKLTKGTDATVLYHLALENAEQRKLDIALTYAKQLLKLETGSDTAGWILLARILSAKKQYDDAETIINAALEQTGKWEHAELLRTRAKLEIAQKKTKDAIRTYTQILAVLQVRKKSCSIGKKCLERKDEDKMLEMETWHDLAKLYTSLSQWQDAEVCLSKSEALCPHSASRCHSRGVLYQAKGLRKEAQKSFLEALDKDPNHVPSLLSMAEILVNLGDATQPVARSFVRQAICIDRTNHHAWHTLGLIHRSEPAGASTAEAADCFEFAAFLADTAPVEPFR